MHAIVSGSPTPAADRSLDANQDGQSGQANGADARHAYSHWASDRVGRYLRERGAEPLGTAPMALDSAYTSTIKPSYSLHYAVTQSVPDAHIAAHRPKRADLGSDLGSKRADYWPPRIVDHESISGIQAPAQVNGATLASTEINTNCCTIVAQGSHNRQERSLKYGAKYLRISGPPSKRAAAHFKLESGD